MAQYKLAAVRKNLKFMSMAYGTHEQCATAIGISKSHMSRLLAGKVKPGPKVLDWMGLRSEVIYFDNYPG